jgi:poly-gamma-glutamate capsule biosynthesis protein CapA/YwtB (metallophosphatase superfamily)
MPTVPPTTPPSPTVGEGTPPPRTRVTIVGDIMLGRGVGDVAAAAGDVSAPLRPMQARLRRADITVGNLESTLSRAGTPQQGGDSFAAPPAVVRGLVGAGFDVLSLANNHTGDFGRRAFLRTLRRIDRSPIERVGAGRDRARAWRPAVVQRNGVRFGFLAFNAIGETPRATASEPGAAEIRMQPRTGPLNPSDLRRARREIARLGRRADVVVVLPHWGDQYTHLPVPDQRQVGRALVDAGADVVVGGHPHWVQRVQRHRGTLIAHSLGNFVFDMDSMRQTMEGVVADLVFVGDRLRRVRFTPYVLGSDFAPRVVRGPRARAVLRPLGVPRVVRLGG